jgi:hypothetical protein
MPVTNIRAIYFPYCLHQLDDKSCIVLNRNYKPIGSATEDYVPFGDVDPKTRITRITPAQARLLAYSGEAKAEWRIYLYDGDGIPNAREMSGYLKRLAVLMKIKLVDALR